MLVLSLAVDGVLPGNNQNDRLAFLNSYIEGFYASTGATQKLHTLKLSNLVSNGFPELHGRAIKAAHVRGVVPYIADLQRRAFAQDPSQLNKSMLAD